VLIAVYELVICFGDLYAVDLFSAGRYYVKGNLSFSGKMQPFLAVGYLKLTLDYQEKASNWTVELKEKVRLQDPGEAFLL